MKSIIIMVALCTTVFAFSQQKPKKETNTPAPEKIVGNDRDANGCIGSAGFIYSIVKKKCVQPWVDGVRFLSTKKTKKNDSPESIFVILSDSKDKAEVIFGGTDMPGVMKRVGKPTETNGTVFYEDKKEQIKIAYKDNAYWYYFQDKALYSSPKSSKDGFYAKYHSKK